MSCCIIVFFSIAIYAFEWLLVRIAIVFGSPHTHATVIQRSTSTIVTAFAQWWSIFSSFMLSFVQKSHTDRCATPRWKWINVSQLYSVVCGVVCSYQFLCYQFMLSVFMFLSFLVLLQLCVCFYHFHSNRVPLSIWFKFNVLNENLFGNVQFAAVCFFILVECSYCDFFLQCYELDIVRCNSRIL